MSEPKYHSAPVLDRLRLLAQPTATSEATEANGSLADMVRHLSDHLGRAVDSLSRSLYRGMHFSEAESDKIALFLRMHPTELWPDWGQVDPFAGKKECANEKCGGWFTPNRDFQRYCSKRCRQNTAQRNYRRSRAAAGNPVKRDRFGEAHRVKQRQFRQANKSRLNERTRVRYHTDPEFRARKLEARRRYAESNREAERLRSIRYRNEIRRTEAA